MEGGHGLQGTTGVIESRFARVQRDKRVFANQLLALCQIYSKFITPWLHLRAVSCVSPEFICC
jgi:hypothetical protein